LKSKVTRRNTQGYVTVGAFSSAIRQLMFLFEKIFVKKLKIKACMMLLENILGRKQT